MKLHSFVAYTVYILNNNFLVTDLTKKGKY